MPSATAGYAPNLEKYLKSLKGQPLDLSIENLISLLKRRQIKGAEPCAVATAHIILQVVAKSKWQNVDGLIDNVSRVGRRLAAAGPNELVIGNIVRRVLGLIRDEAAEDRNEPQSESEAPTSPTNAAPQTTDTLPSSYAKQDSAGDYVNTSSRPGLFVSQSTVNLPKSLFHLLSASPPTDVDHAPGSPFATSGASTPQQRSATTNQQVHALRSEVIIGIEEIKDEISQVDDQIAAFADVQIHSGDYLLVHRPSPTVERFILRAAVKRKFTVLIVTEPPRKQLEEIQHASFRKKLSAAGITVVNILNGGLMAYMARVDKVILGAKAIVANGGVVSDAGTAAIARAAKEQGNAVIVLGGIYKLSPETPFADNSVIEWADPSSYVDFADGQLVGSVEVRTAASEMVPANLIDTYVTNLGTHTRDHLSSLIADHYKPEDIDFHLWDELHHR